MSPRPHSTPLRRAAFERYVKPHPLIEGRRVLYCHKCDAMLDPVVHAWELDHIVARAIGGSDEPDNLAILCVPCHRAKTKTDVTSIAKGKRMAEKHYGIKRPKKIMPGSRADYLKKKLDGSVVRRDSE
jgi:hypothetical protein